MPGTQCPSMNSCGRKGGREWGIRGSLGEITNNLVVTVRTVYITNSLKRLPFSYIPPNRIKSIIQNIRIHHVRKYNQR